ncbi:MAG: exodeoxyribonuclease VII small subunit [Elusimicrobia bacterium]|nr:exodeoxyribonuclease VII small subunit [Elusimicrobiota bacterium]
MNNKTPKKEPFETSLEKLEEIVRQLECGEKGLEQSLELFEKGVVLAKELSRQLEEAKRKVEVLSKENGKLSRKAFEEAGD